MSAPAAPIAKAPALRGLSGWLAFAAALLLLPLILRSGTALSVMSLIGDRKSVV